MIGSHSECIMIGGIHITDRNAPRIACERFACRTFGHDLCADGSAQWSHRHCHRAGEGMHTDGHCGMTDAPSPIVTSTRCQCGTGPRYDGCDDDEDAQSWSDDDDEDDPTQYTDTTVINGTSYSDTGRRLEGIAHKHSVEDEDGNRYIVKAMSDEECDAEYIMPRIFHAAGVTCQTVERIAWDDVPFCSACESGSNPLTRDPETRSAVLCGWLDDYSDGRLPRYAVDADIETHLVIVMTDYLVKNDDRHGGNIGSVNNRTTVAIIDNGLAFNNHRMYETFRKYIDMMGLYTASMAPVSYIVTAFERVMTGMDAAWSEMTYAQRSTVKNRLDTVADDVTEWYEDENGADTGMVISSGIDRLARMFEASH